MARSRPSRQWFGYAACAKQWGYCASICGELLAFSQRELTYVPKRLRMQVIATNEWYACLTVTCNNKFGEASTQIAAVKDLRRLLWDVDPQDVCQVANKGKRLIKNALRVDRLNGSSFIRIATDFTKNLLNSIVDVLLNPTERPTVYCKPTREGIMDAVAFLRVYFKQPGQSGAVIIL